ncbi:MAG: spore germination protein, partial [Tissierellaceae bacterium]
MSSISIYLEENIDLIQSVFNKDDTLVLRKFQTQNNTKKQFALFFINGMVDISIINNNILMPIMYINEDTDDISTDFLQDQIIISSQIESSQDMEHIVDSLISGDVLLFVDGIPECLIIDCKGFNTRQIDEPEIEKSIKGPREGFNESLVTNLSLIRRKIKNKDLKFEYKKIGTTSHTKACICYIDGVADPKLIDEINKRIDGIKIDGVLDVKYIQELIDDTPFSIFETSGSTEKPDVLAAKLLEGRVGIFLDGTPSVMTAPFLFIENFQAPQDYYTNYYYASIIRILRIFASIITTGLPAIYLSLVTYHREVLPSSLLL